MAKHPKRPRDPNQLAKLIVDITVGEVPNDSPKGPDTPRCDAFSSPTIRRISRRISSGVRAPAM